MPHSHPRRARGASLILTGAGRRLAGAAAVSALLWLSLWLVVG